MINLDCRTCSLILSILLLSSCAKVDYYNQAKWDFAHGAYHRSFEELWMPAKNGNYRAQYAMGYMYYYGIGTNKDQDLGRHLIRMAASKGYPPAAYAMELITHERVEQYVPFETYASTQNRMRG